MNKNSIINIDKKVIIYVLRGVKGFSPAPLLGKHLGSCQTLNSFNQGIVMFVSLILGGNIADMDEVLEDSN